MSVRDRATATAAGADMHVEAAIDHRAWNLGLVLHGQVRFAYLPTRAVRAMGTVRHRMNGLSTTARRTGSWGLTGTVARQFEMPYLR